VYICHLLQLILYVYIKNYTITLKVALQDDLPSWYNIMLSEGCWFLCWYCQNYMHSTFIGLKRSYIHHIIEILCGTCIYLSYFCFP